MPLIDGKIDDTLLKRAKCKFKETCRLRAKAPFPLLVALIRNHFTGTEPDLAWS